MGTALERPVVEMSRTSEAATGSPSAVTVPESLPQSELEDFEIHHLVLGLDDSRGLAEPPRERIHRGHENVARGNEVERERADGSGLTRGDRRAQESSRALAERNCGIRDGRGSVRGLVRAGDGAGNRHAHRDVDARAVLDERTIGSPAAALVIARGNAEGNCLPLWVDQGDGGVVGSTKD